MIKMAAFDFDGTIAHTIPMCIEALKKAVIPYAGHKLTENEILETFGLNETGMVKAVVQDNWELALQDFYFYYEIMHSSCTEPFPLICDLIKYLKEKNVIVALITGKGQKSCDISLKRLSMENYFSEIMVGDEKHLNKADSIIKLLKKYYIKADEFYYIGDALSDVMACRKAGVTCLSATWSGNVDLEKLKKINSTYIFDNIASLKIFLESKL
ncbi:MULTISPECIES: HAD-IA family hydrolase [unclassified Clostridium]|uniref:HAD family hydrolase n=1 Tax=unclassified Clostridium TaxID=2614128 RepID=UPI00029738C3|nr:MULTISPECIES: HAD-IA family hydrolase [unclassified Clostridium]EKQ56440.1 MAG: haloacid dehalogenase superfamily enzyme, subfamily IA [Clostridium sp. Maddingley MBC34-26]